MKDSSLHQWFSTGMIPDAHLQGVCGNITTPWGQGATDICDVGTREAAEHPRLFRRVPPFTPHPLPQATESPSPTDVSSAKSEKPSHLLRSHSLRKKNKKNPLWPPEHQPLPSLPTSTPPHQSLSLVNMLQEQNVSECLRNQIPKHHFFRVFFSTWQPKLERG